MRHADRTPISPTGLCPASQYGSTLVKIPAPGTEDDDHNPPRIALAQLCSTSPWATTTSSTATATSGAPRLTVINLTNKYALYNFLSTFSGTHYVTPRTVTADRLSLLTLNRLASADSYGNPRSPAARHWKLRRLP